MKITLGSAISTFGMSAKQKLANAAATGQPEDQLRAPFEQLLTDMAELVEVSRKTVVAVGESSLSDLKTRPDYAVTVQGALVGFVELKAPGKGADPRKFRDPHDKAQWERLRSLPNVLYTDGNAFSLWQDGDLVGDLVSLTGDIESSGSKLGSPPELLVLFETFLRWAPIAPRSAKELAHVSARLCRLLRDEVTEQLGLGSEALTALATDWRKLLFPEANDKTFADGYAQAVTFGLLMARAKNIRLAAGLQQVATELTKSNSLIGAALRLLTDNAENQATLKTSLGTLTRVLDAVNWSKVSKGDPDAWLYFYEEFLEVYDNKLRKQTGSYYAPPEVVSAMVRLVDDVLRTDRFGLHAGLASPAVTLADPATGTGTFLLGVLRKIADTVEADEGAGSVRGAIDAAVKRVIAFEMQLGPFAVAQLRVVAEIVDLTGAPPSIPLRMFVTNTLGNPADDEGWIPGLLAPIAKSRKDANKIKRDEPITVVIGNPPYKEKAKGRGGWIEGEDVEAARTAPLSEWMPPREWGAGAHSKHLRNLYVYFWRWATWKVFDHHPANRAGVVCYITVAGFLGGQGFQKMRDYLRRACDDIWVIDCSPEGYQPGVATRIFQGVQQPVCIVLASRSAKSDGSVPAKVRFHALPTGPRTNKFKALGALRLETSKWGKCPTDWRAPFLPASAGAWATYPKLEDLFIYSGSGVMPGRTWIIGPDADSLVRRWNGLVAANLVTADLNLTDDVFVRDRQGNLTYRISVSSGSLRGNGPSIWPAISASGRFIAFPSEASNLVGGDSSAAMDVFLHDRDATGFAGLCYPGIDGVIACPCGQAANPTGGCANFGSGATSGAVLSASGVAHVGSDTVLLATSNHRSPAQGILNVFFSYKPGTATPTTGNTSGAGVRCIGSGGSLKRLYTMQVFGGVGSKPGMGDLSVSARSASFAGHAIVPPETRYYFNVYRDGQAGQVANCNNPAITTNLTNMGSITWSP